VIDSLRAFIVITTKILFVLRKTIYFQKITKMNSIWRTIYCASKYHFFREILL